MTAAERGLVRSAVAAHRVVLEDLETLVPALVARIAILGRRMGRPRPRQLPWRLAPHPGPSEITVALPQATITPDFPTDANGWAYSWSKDCLTVRTDVPEPSVRIIQVGAEHG